MADQMGVAIHSRLLAHCANTWQELSVEQGAETGRFSRFSAGFRNWHAPCFKKGVIAGGFGGTGSKTHGPGRPDMFSFDRFARIVAAGQGADVPLVIDGTRAHG